MPNLTKGFRTLGATVNKVLKGQDEKETKEGMVSEPMPELSVELSNDELLKLTKDWEKVWSKFETGLEARRKDNENYWLGKQFSNVEDVNQKRPLVDNITFESLETFLPVATRQNPDPVIEGDGTNIGGEFADQIKKLVVRWADDVRFKLKLKRVTRNWALYMLGAIKMGWSIDDDNITGVVVRPQRLILDPDASIDEGGEYSGKYLGERKKDTAENIIDLFPDKKEFISMQVKEKLGTEINYTEWWTDDFVFWTFNGEVLDKQDNPNWNEDREDVVFDEFGTEETQFAPGLNHFNRKKKPYIFLTIFNLGLHPVDDTGLIEQNLTTQDLINKRLRQIDKNVDNMNSGMVVSGDAFTKDQAQEVQRALRAGGVVWVPSGAPRDAVERNQVPGLPAEVFGSLQDYRSRALEVFGTKGISSQGLQQEDTVRGKIIQRGSDSSRIGGGVTEFLEQFADSVFNWVVQMIYVYYDLDQVARVFGEEEAQRFLENRDRFNGQLKVSVKEGSLIPKDDLTKRNEAVDLWSAGAIDPITLFERLEDPNPLDTAKRLFLWQTNPAALFQEDSTPEEMAQIQQQSGTIPQVGQPEPEPGTEGLGQV